MESLNIIPYYPPMNFKIESSDGVTIVNMQMDALDAGNIMEFKTSISPILEQSTKVVFNMSRVRFMDSSGIGAVLSCLRKLHIHGGSLKMFGVGAHLAQLFKLVRLDRIIDILDSRRKAIRAFRNE